jgi:hypothetical protein
MNAGWTAEKQLLPPSPHFSHGLIFVVSQSVGRFLTTDIRSEVAVDMGRRCSRRADCGLKLDFPHGSAEPIAGFWGKRLLGGGGWIQQRSASKARA